MHRRLRVCERPGAAQCGAAAVETALVLSAVLIPLLVGVLQYGFYFWKLQGVPTLDANVNQASIVGTYCPNTEGQLLARVRDAALVAARNVDDGAGLPLSSGNIVASVVSYVPGELGVDVQIRMTSPVMSDALALLPLPNDGNVVSDTFLRLENVRITSASC